MVINPFQSFWMAGYECADHINAFGYRVNLQALTGHVEMLEADYHDLAPFGIRTVREGICWSEVEQRPYEYDWTTVTTMIRTGRRLGVQQVWDLCHFGFPDDLTPLHPMFARRFAAMCRAFVLHYRSLEADGKLVVTPINEVSFLSWLGGDVRGTVPFCTGQGWEVKQALMRAYIEAIYAMRHADPGIRLLTTEPLVNIVAPLDATPQQVQEATMMHNDQYQSLDILCGVLCPELGGSPSLLDMLGFNYYHNNQLIMGTHSSLPWTHVVPDVRWRSLSSLMEEAYLRYRRPIVLSETSYAGDDRPAWMQYIGEETEKMLVNGLPLWGVCLYPIIDRPDWDHTDQWHHSGLWDARLAEKEPPGRVLHAPYAATLQNAQHRIKDMI